MPITPRVRVKGSHNRVVSGAPRIGLCWAVTTRMLYAAEGCELGGDNAKGQAGKSSCGRCRRGGRRHGWAVAACMGTSSRAPGAVDGVCLCLPLPPCGVPGNNPKRQAAAEARSCSCICSSSAFLVIHSADHPRALFDSQFRWTQSSGSGRRRRRAPRSRCGARWAPTAGWCVTLGCLSCFSRDECPGLETCRLCWAPTAGWRLQGPVGRGVRVECCVQRWLIRGGRMVCHPSGSWHGVNTS